MGDERAWGRFTGLVINVVIICEGQTEAAFMAKVVQPALIPYRVYLTSRLIPTSRKGRGGSLTFDRVRVYVRNTLRERLDTYITTFFDLYGLKKGFPGFARGGHLTDPIRRAELIEEEFRNISTIDSGVRPDRFFPHIQPFEFEALLFSNVERLGDIDSRWEAHLKPLKDVRNSVRGPEYIDDGPSTHPSARLQALPGYRKVRHGTEAAKHLGLDVIRSECRHFGRWLTHLEGLQPLPERL